MEAAQALGCGTVAEEREGKNEGEADWKTYYQQR